MKREFTTVLLELKRKEDGEEYSGDPIDYITRATKKAAINAAKKGVQRPDVMSAWVYEEGEMDEPYRCYIYKGDADITDQTGW